MKMEFKKEEIQCCYEIGEEVGSGQFARVYRCRHRPTGIEYAAKFIRKRRAQASRRGTSVEDIQREVTILKAVDHKNIIKLYEVYEDKQDVVLILELVSGGELFDYLKERDKVDEREAVVILRQILDGLKHLHDRNILHMDLKPENLMLKEHDSGQVKIIDFGLSRRLCGAVECRDMVGTAEFVAPEVINFDALCLATDMWSIGVIAYILLSGCSPFLGNDKQETLSNVSAVNYSLDNEFFSDVSPDAKSFISQLLIRDPRRRVTVDDCLVHPWIKNAAVTIPVCIVANHSDDDVTTRVFQDDMTPTSSSTESCLTLDGGKIHVNETLSVGGNDSAEDVEASFPDVQPEIFHDSACHCLENVFQSADGKETVQLKIQSQRLWRRSFHSIRFCLRLSKLVSQDLPEVLRSAASCREDISTELQLAVAAGNFQKVKVILEKNVSHLDQSAVCQADVFHEELASVFHAASEAGCLRVVEYLCEMGISLDIKDQKNGDSVLHLATQCGRAEVVRCLITHGADISLKNKKGQSALDVAIEMNHSDIIDVLSRMKQGNKRHYVSQLQTANSPLSRVRVKVVGNSGTGKTKLIESLKYSLFGGFLQNAFPQKVIPNVNRNSGRKHIANGNCQLSRNGFKCNSSSSASEELWRSPCHDRYTRGIFIENMAISSVDTVSVWEFSGYESYHVMYDWLIGDVDCLYVIVVDGSQSDEVQLSQISFWLNFIQCRTPLNTPIGFAGCLPLLPTVLLVATHADSVCCSWSRDSECIDISRRLLPTVTQMFSNDFHVFPCVFLLNAHNPASNAMKSLRQTLCSLKRTLCQSLPPALGLLEATLSELKSWRRKFAHFPVVSSSDFARHVRLRVNPLSTDFHLQRLIFQLQVIGEVICIENPKEEDSFLILDPLWFGSSLIGSIFSFENLLSFQPNGRICLQIVRTLFGNVDEVNFMKLLEALELCFSSSPNEQIEAEFPCLYSKSSNISHIFAMFKQNRDDYVHGGVRIGTQRHLANQVACVFPRVQFRINRHEFPDGEVIDFYNFRCCSLCIRGNIRAFVTLACNDRAIDVRLCGPSDERSTLFYFKERICDVVCDAMKAICPGFHLERNPLSCVQLKSTFGDVYAYCAKDIHSAMMNDCMTVVLPGKVKQHESVCDLIAFGCREIFSHLISGTRLHVSRLSLEARRSLSRVVDPPDSTGRDWCLLALSLGLAGHLPSLEGAESPTDASIEFWSRDSNATTDVLIRKLGELGRKDAVDALFSCLPLFIHSSLLIYDGFPSEELTPFASSR